MSEAKNDNIRRSGILPTFLGRTSSAAFSRRLDQLFYAAAVRPGDQRGVDCRGKAALVPRDKGTACEAPVRHSGAAGERLPEKFTETDQGHPRNGDTRHQIYWSYETTGGRGFLRNEEALFVGGGFGVSDPFSPPQIRGLRS